MRVPGSNTTTYQLPSTTRGRASVPPGSVQQEQERQAQGFHTNPPTDHCVRFRHLKLLTFTPPALPSTLLQGRHAHGLPHGRRSL